MPKVTKNIIDFNKIYEGNYGPYKIIEEVEPRILYNPDGTVKSNERMCKVHFLKTGYEADYMVRNATKGNIRDPYYPSICGVACLGNVMVGRNGPNKKIYTHFISMIRRCYYPKEIGYSTYGDLELKYVKDGYVLNIS